MHDKTAPGHGPKQQPVERSPAEGDGTARQGSAAPDGYWLHDDFGPHTYCPPTGDAKMPAKSKAQQKAAGAALASKRGEPPKGSLKGDRKPRQTP